MENYYKKTDLASSKFSMRTYLQQIGQLLLVLFAIQIGRSLIVTGLWTILQPATDSPLWAFMDMVAFGVIGTSLLFFLRPSTPELALEWKSASRIQKTIYVGLGIFTLLLIFSTYFFQPDIFVMNLNAAIVIVIFEELLFRGWGWTKLQKSASFKASGFLNWLVISFVFAIWHFGYLDIYLLKVAPANPDMDWGFFFLMKFLTTLLIGLVVGIPRWRTKRVYGSLILHSLINLFGR